MDIAFEPDFEIAQDDAHYEFKMVGDCSELFEALARAQSRFKALAETKEANVKTYKYRYADLAAVLDCVRPCLNAEGLAVMQSATKGRVQTIIGHGSGAVLIFTTEFANSDLPPQQQGSLFTFYKRYALNAAVGVASGGEDIDASDTLDGGKVAEIVNLPPKTKPRPVKSTDTPDWNGWEAHIRTQLSDVRTNNPQGIDEWFVALQNEFEGFRQFDSMAHKTLVEEINQAKKESRNG